MNGVNNATRWNVSLKRLKIILSRTRNLQKVEPRKLHDEIKKVTKSCQAELKLELDIPGVDDHDDEKGEPDAINSMFVSVSDGIPPLFLNVM